MHIVALFQCLLAIMMLPAIAKDLQLWRRVSVNSSWFSSSVHQESRDLSLMNCGGACSPQIWCTLWCYDTTSGCLLTDLLVTRSDLDEQSPDAKVCFTRRAKEYAAGANISSSYNWDLFHSKENLVDGIYGRDIDQCHYLDFEYQPWVLFDLGRLVPVQSIVLVAQPNDYAARYFRHFEVRVGKTLPSEGDFSSYTIFGKFDDEGMPNQELTMNSLKPVMCQYVSIQCYIASHFQLCHVEIR